MLDLDTRLMTNYYKSSGFYDAKVSSKLAKINEAGNAEIIYSIDEGERYIVKKISTNIDVVFDKLLRNISGIIILLLKLRKYLKIWMKLLKRITYSLWSIMLKSKLEINRLTLF